MEKEEIIPEPVCEPETQFGFEPEDNSIDQGDNGFEPVGISLDDTYGTPGQIIGSNNEFSKMIFISYFL